MVEDRSKIVETLDHPDMRCLADRFFDEGSAPTGVQTVQPKSHETKRIELGSERVDALFVSIALLSQQMVGAKTACQ